MALWFIAFPGYITFLFTWVGVLAGLFVQIANWFIPPSTHPLEIASSPGVGNGFGLGPLATVLAGVLCVAALAIAYWTSVHFTIKVIRTIADFLETSDLVVKLVGLPLGCGLATIAAMLFRPQWGLLTLGIGATLGVIGLCSFGLEHRLIKVGR